VLLVAELTSDSRANVRHHGISVETKRVYESASADDGYRVLIDRLWPRGLSRTDARVDAWARALAPSDELRRWFAHRPERFDEFRRRYTEELREHADEVAELRRQARGGKVTLVYAARDSEHSNAAVLAPIIRRGFPR
jgi:uncharacterized protein YeaO (DUF488 family)